MSSVPPNPTPNPATRPAPQIPRAVPPKSNNRFIMAASAIGLGAAGYYFYTAGGDATVAKKKVEGRFHSTFNIFRDFGEVQMLILIPEDGHRLVDSLPGKFQGHPHEKAAEVNLAQAGAKIDRAAAEGTLQVHLPKFIHCGLSI